MLPPFFQRAIPYFAASWIFFTVPSVLLAVGMIRKVSRREWFAAVIFLAVLLGWLARIATGIPDPAFDPAKLPADLYIPQPDSASLTGPVGAVISRQPVLRLQAPSTMTWILRGTERELSFEYGYIPQAYLEGRPDGAEFILELSDGASSRRIFQRTLAPLSQLTDRQPQFSRVILPPFQPGDQLTLKIGAGEHGNNAWDWLYVNNLKFRRSSRFLPSQFPSFQTLPWRAAIPTGLLYQSDGHATFLQLDAPSRLDYLLKGTERRLSFSYGILPGAYHNGGNTDGAAFRVELHAKDQPVQVLFARLLQPVGVEADRGRQYLSLALPAVSRGSQLVLTIGPGPAQNGAWDWTYINRLTLE